MSEGNGNPIESQSPVIIEMRIVQEIGKMPQVHFPLLMDKVASYGFLKLAEKTLDAHYKKLESGIIKPPKGGIMDFVRGGKNAS